MEGSDKVPGSVNPRFAAGLPFPVPEIPEFKAFRDSGKFSSNFPREPPSRSQKQPQPSRVFLILYIGHDDGKSGVGFKGGSLHDGFGGFDSFQTIRTDVQKWPLWGA